MTAVRIRRKGAICALIFDLVAPPVGAFVVSVVLVYAFRLSMRIRSFIRFSGHSSGLLTQTNEPIPLKRAGALAPQGQTQSTHVM